VDRADDFIQRVYRVPYEFQRKKIRGGVSEAAEMPQSCIPIIGGRHMAPKKLARGTLLPPKTSLFIFW
jgi:hypothetical protein